MLTSCSGEPDERRLVNGPGNDIVYIRETFYGSTLSSDETNIYAVSKGNSRSRRLVLSGENLSIKKLAWKDSTNVVICLTEGITSHYSNLVTVPLQSGSINIHNHLVEDC
jgi:hypothetical protein